MLKAFIISMYLIGAALFGWSMIVQSGGMFMLSIIIIFIPEAIRLYNEWEKENEELITPERLNVLKQKGYRKP